MHTKKDDLPILPLAQVTEGNAQTGDPSAVELDLSAQRDYVDWFTALQKTQEWENYQETLAVFENSKSFKVKAPHDLDLGNYFSTFSSLNLDSSFKDHLTEKLALSNFLHSFSKTIKPKFNFEEDIPLTSPTFLAMVGLPFFIVGFATLFPAVGVIGATLLGTSAVMSIPLVKIGSSLDMALRARKKITDLTKTQTDIAVCFSGLSPMKSKIESMKYSEKALLNAVKCESRKIINVVSDSGQDCFHNTLKKLIEPLYDVREGAMGLHQMLALHNWRCATHRIISRGYDLAFEMNASVEMANLFKKPPEITSKRDLTDSLENIVIVRRKPKA